jgi:hypothetical protein
MGEIGISSTYKYSLGGITRASVEAAHDGLDNKKTERTKIVVNERISTTDDADKANCRVVENYMEMINFLGYGH